MKTLIKRLATKYLPRPLYEILLQWHYLRAIPRINGTEEKSFLILEKFINPGVSVLDVGANYGAYSVFCAGLLQGQGEIIAVEPIPLTAKILRAVLAQHCSCATTVIEAAATNTGGSVRMSLPQHNDGRVNYYQARILGNSAASWNNSLVVKPIRIDDLTQNLRFPLAFIKLDVEGAEWGAINSAVDTLQRFHPLCLIEVSGDPTQKETESNLLFDKMQHLGYTAYYQEGEKLRPWSVGTSAIDYFFLTAEHRQHAQKQGLL